MRFSLPYVEEVAGRTHDCHKSSVAVRNAVPPADEVESQAHDCRNSSVAVESTGPLALALRCACCRIRRQAHMGLSPPCADEVESPTRDCHKQSVAVESTGPDDDSAAIILPTCFDVCVNLNDVHVDSRLLVSHYTPEPTMHPRCKHNPSMYAQLFRDCDDASNSQDQLLNFIPRSALRSVISPVGITFPEKVCPVPADKYLESLRLVVLRSFPEASAVAAYVPSRCCPNSDLGFQSQIQHQRWLSQTF